MISTGLLLAPVGLPALQYNCTGGEVFPVYTASPFIYRSASLATSMAHDYYLAGLMADVLLWSLVILFVRRLIQKYSKSNLKAAKYFYNFTKYTLLALSVIIILMELNTEGQTIRSHINLNKEAANWGMVCSPEFTFEH